MDVNENLMLFNTSSTSRDCKAMNRREQQFVKTVWEYYERHGRRSLPWRLTTNPYRILVSEIMLQQTQVDRVIPKYRAFLKAFPTIKKLSVASLGEVLILWQGLGYNRRAKMLHACAQKVVHECRGRFPKTHSELMELPGVGHYTAGAVMAFAYNEAISIIETNIRTVFIHHFFKDAADISDQEIVRSVERTLDRKNPREWYYALMDYGAYLKKEFGNPNVQSKHYAKQSTFKGSDREIRGAIIRLLTTRSATRTELLKSLPFEDIRIDAQVEKLLQEQMLVCRAGKYSLPR